MMQQVWHRLQLLFAQGRGLRVSRDKIQAKIQDAETPPNVDRVEPYGFNHWPLEGCQAYINFPSGDRSYGIAVLVGDRRYQLALSVGEVAINDDLGQKVHLTRSGIVIDGAGLPITLTNAPKVRAETALFEVTGQIKDLCDTTGKTMSSMRGIYNSHTHSDPQGGAVSAPNQSM